LFPATPLEQNVYLTNLGKFTLFPFKSRFRRWCFDILGARRNVVNDPLRFEWTDYGIVVVGLPNEGEPLRDALLDVIQPKMIVIADSEFPANRRASRKLKERLIKQNVPVIFTRNSGAVNIITDRSGWSLEAMDGQIFNFAALPERLKHSVPAE
jgi:hypothetical protein